LGTSQLASALFVANLDHGGPDAIVRYGTKPMGRLRKT